MTRDQLLAALTAERYGPATQLAAAVEPDDDLVRARRRRDLNAALNDAPPNYRRGRNTA